ncbi:unnamed protein product, partial [Sphacelaria rigidula]
ALSTDTTPRGLLVRVPGDTTEKIMTGASQTSGYKLERSTFNQMNEPFLITKPGQQKIVYPEIPLWGKYRVYNTPREAMYSIPQEILHQQCTRMVLVASNRQLGRLVEPGREACQPEAALYLKIADTCPFYHLEWDTGGEG